MIKNKLSGIGRTPVDVQVAAADMRAVALEPLEPYPIQPSTWWELWQKVRAASLTPAGATRLAADETPLRPASLRDHLAARLRRPERPR